MGSSSNQWMTFLNASHRQNIRIFNKLPPILSTKDKKGGITDRKRLFCALDHCYSLLNKT